MKLYYTRAACSLVVRIIINELGVPCEFESVDLKTKKTETNADFLSINPKGAVPVLKTDDGEILTENAIILQYLADKYKGSHLLAAVPEMKRYHTLEWVNFITTEIHKSIGLLFNPAVNDEMKNTIVVPLIEKKFEFINQHLQNKKYLLGDTFTLPDAYLFVMITWLNHFKIDVNRWPNVAKFFAENKSRAAIQESLKQERLG